MIEIPTVGTYDIVAQRSEIRFRVKHRFGTGMVRGRFAVASGVLVVTEPPTLSTMTITADAASFSSGNTSRDAKIRSAAFLDTAQHPAITFSSASVENAADGSWQAHGTLDAHGVAGPTTFTLTEAATSENSLRLVAVGTVDRYAHGVEVMKGMAGRHVHLTVVLHAVRV